MSGVTTAVVAAVAEVAAAVGSVSAGTGLMGAIAAEVGSTAALGLGGAAIGAGMGTVESAITGGDIGKGALGGAIGGAFTGGLGSALSGSLGATAGYGLAGAAGGAVSGAATGGNPLTGAVMGGVGGAITGSLQAPEGTTGAATGTAGAGASSGSLASAPGGAPVDLSQVGALNSGTTSGFGSMPSFDETGAPVSTAAGPATGGTVVGGSVSPNFTGAATTGGSDPWAGMSGQQQVAQIGNGAGSVPVSSVGTFNSPQAAAAGASGTFDIGGALPSGPTAVAPGAATAPQGPSSLSQFMSDPSLASAGHVLASNPQVAVGALGMGYNMIKGDQQPKGYNQLQSEAQQLASQGSQLQQEALNNSLPPAAQAQLNEASNAMKAQIRSTYAQMGLSGSSMEAQAMAGVDAKVAGEGYTMIQGLLQQGVQESNMAGNLYAQLMQVNSQQAAAQTAGIGNFAAALGGAGLKGAFA